MIHVTRSFLLNDFTDLSRRPQIPHPTVANILQKCIGAAENVITLVDSLAKQGVMIQSFWFTHYVCFCAIIVVYIYIIQQHQSQSSSSSSFSPQGTEYSTRLHDLFNLAEACQQHLAEATRKNCPSRRYSIILEELRREVHRQIGSPLPSSPPINLNQEDPLDQDQFLFTNVDQSVSLDSSVLDYAPPQNFLAPGFSGASFDPMVEIGLLGSLEGPNWWAQLDSWVSVVYHLS